MARNALRCLLPVLAFVSLALPAVSRLWASTPGQQQSPGPRYGGRYYGHWCGPQWSGGESGTVGTAEPVDDLDLQCRYHDLAYVAADDYWQPKYDTARSPSERSEACRRWYAVYRSADVAMTRATRALPRLMIAGPNSPDTWNYDPRRFGVHPWSVAQRNGYRVTATAFGNLGVFVAPPCVIARVSD